MTLWSRLSAFLSALLAAFALLFARQQAAAPQLIRPSSLSLIKIRSSSGTPAPRSEQESKPTPSIHHLLRANRRWARQMTAADPDFFTRLAHLQKPKYLWIGCSDSRVPANQILGLPPGGVFVHSNVANLVVNTDLNMLSVLQYAVERLEVDHIIVCGHYDCGGIKASLQPQELGLIDNWLRNIRDVARLHQDALMSIEDEVERGRRLVELNVIEQAMNLHKTGIVQRKRLSRKSEGGKSLPKVHACVYSVATGMLTELDQSPARTGFVKYGPLYNLLGNTDDFSSLFAIECEEGETEPVEMMTPAVMLPVNRGHEAHTGLHRRILSSAAPHGSDSCCGDVK